MPVLPSSLALTTIADGSLAVAADERNNFSAIQTAVNSLITTFGSGTANQVLLGSGTTLTWGGGPYTSYTPTWTSSGTPPAIGNAVVTALYVQVGKMVHCYGKIVFGSTSTFGTGGYSFALPITASANALTVAVAGSSLLVDTSAGFQGNALVELATTTTMTPTLGTTYLGTRTAVLATVPWTWAVSDVIAWNFTYEAA